MKRPGQNAMRLLDDLTHVLAAMPLDPPLTGTLADLQRPTLDSLRRAIATWDERHRIGVGG